jgi:hypothetical protein
MANMFQVFDQDYSVLKFEQKKTKNPLIVTTIREDKNADN